MLSQPKRRPTPLSMAPARREDVAAAVVSGGGGGARRRRQVSTAASIIAASITAASSASDSWRARRPARPRPASRARGAAGAPRARVPAARRWPSRRRGAVADGFALESDGASPPIDWRCFRAANFTAPPPPRSALGRLSLISLPLPLPLLSSLCRSAFLHTGALNATLTARGRASIRHRRPSRSRRTPLPRPCRCRSAC